MPGRDIVVVGTSAGGVEALRALVGGLPADFPGSVFVVMHTAPDSPGVLRLTRGPKENRFRPAIDPLFRSAAAVYGPRVVGVILTGGLDDGTSGLWGVKRLGGVAVVQDPEEAFMSSMPLSALNQVDVDYTLPLAEIAPLLSRLARTSVAEQGGYEVPEDLKIEVKIAMEDNALESGITRLGSPSIFTCPECHGTLLQLKENGRTRYRCHTGHAYSADSLLSELTESVEETMWSAIRSIDESAMLMRHMAEHVRESDAAASERFLEKAREAERRSKLARQAVFDHENLS